MYIKKNISMISTSTLFITLIFLITLLSYIVFDIYPVVEFLKYVDNNNLNWMLMLIFGIPIGLIIIDRYNYKIHEKEKIDLFEATVHTIQDQLQTTYAMLQIVILDFEENLDCNLIIPKLNESLIEMNNLIKDISEFDLNSF